MRQRALRAFSRLPLVVAEARKALLAYCHLDTLAMVRVWETLKKIV
ncbi:MAG: DNA polymerase [Prevotella sp.]|nr:DNA polymerase [Prevotella sp.]